MKARPIAAAARASLPARSRISASKGCKFSLLKNKQAFHCENGAAHSYAEAASSLIDWLEGGAGKAHAMGSRADIDRIAHRVVHGADEFPQTATITSAVVDRIAALEELAPLHNQPAVKVIEVARSKFGADFPMFAIFDNRFPSPHAARGCRLCAAAEIGAAPPHPPLRVPRHLASIYGAAHR